MKNFSFAKVAMSFVVLLSMVACSGYQDTGPPDLTDMDQVEQAILNVDNAELATMVVAQESLALEITDHQSSKTMNHFSDYPEDLAILTIYEARIRGDNKQEACLYLNQITAETAKGDSNSWNHGKNFVVREEGGVLERSEAQYRHLGIRTIQKDKIKLPENG